jgi:hypothetical protein
MKPLLRANAVLMLTAAALTAAALTACGGGGGGSNPPPPPSDTSAPDTTLGSTPAALTNSSSASFTFTASEAGATFEARTDAAAFAAVTSPRALGPLSDGSHTFEVRARDAAGNVDASPASFTWVIDTAPPDTQITSAPSNSAIVNAATFAISAGEPGSILEASVDGAPFAVVTSPHTVTGVADGNHTIQFRARDAAGNVDATPATASWSLDASAPVVRLIFPTRLFYTDADTITVRGSAQDPRAVTALSINGVAAYTSDAFAHWSAVIPVPFGTTSVAVTSSDGLGNTQVLNAATMVNRGVFVNDPRGIGYDRQRDRIIVVDQRAGAVVAIGRTDGITRMLSPGPGPVPAPGTAPGIGLQDLVIDAANDRALILDYPDDALIAVDLASGVRSVVSAGNGSSSPTRIHSLFLTLDAAGQNAYVSAGATMSVVRVNLATGLRTVVSSPTVGTGDALVNIYGIVYDAVTNPAAPRLLVITSPAGPGGILAVDIATGNRTPFSIGTTGGGNPIVSASAMVMDAAGQRVLVINGARDIVAVSLANGDRTLINTSGLGTGPSPFFGFHAAFDPVARRLFASQMLGDLIEVDVVTQVRTVISGSNIGPEGLRSTQLGLSLEPTSGTAISLVSVEGAFGAVSRFDLATAGRASVSYFDTIGPGVGAGPSLRNATDLKFDARAANGRSALVLVQRPITVQENPKLVSVDLASGNRTRVAEIVVGTYGEPQKMALDVAGNRVVFTHDELSPAIPDQLYAMDLATGVTSTISDGSHSGPTLGNASHIVLEPAANPTRALVADGSQPRILAIDLATGTRTVFDTLLAGRGGPMFVDTANARLIMANADAPASLVTVPLAFDGSSRLLLSGTSPVSGVVRGGGPPQVAVSSMAIDVPNDVAYVFSGGSRSLMAIDMLTGDRVVIER